MDARSKVYCDDANWPDLAAFRRACLAEQFDQMQRITDTLHYWYCNENPQGLDMAQLAKIFQAQHYARENDPQGLKRVIAGDAWTVNYPRTA